MPNKVREIYLLSRESNLSNKEIAKKMGITEQTVKNQLSKALSILKKTLPYLVIFVGWKIFWGI